MTRLFRAATMTMLVVGCTNSATTTSLRTNSTEPAERLAEVTLHVAGMNERLQVL